MTDCYYDRLSVDAGGLKFLYLIPQMAQGGDWINQQHTRTDVAHHCSDAFTIGLSITMNLTLAAA